MGEDNSSGALKLAAGIIITCLLISLVFVIYNLASNTSESAMGKIEGMNSEMLESEYTKYEGNNISGTSVLNAIKTFKNDVICITVNNGNAVTEYIYDSSLSTKITSPTHIDAGDKTQRQYYINPSSTFVGEVIRDNTGGISGITFTIQ